jgi:hypothetical protein
MKTLQIGPVALVLDSIAAVETDCNLTSSDEELHLYSEDSASPVILIVERAEEIEREIHRLKGWDTLSDSGSSG